MPRRRGRTLEDYVNTLLKLGGFTAKPRIIVSTKLRKKKYEIDVLASYYKDMEATGKYGKKPLIVRLVVQTKEIRKYINVKKLVDTWKEINKKVRADGVLLVVSGRVISREEENYAKKRKVTLWNDEKLEQFVQDIERYRKRAAERLINALNIRFEKGKPFRIPAIKIRQPGGEFYIFSIDARKLLEIAYVDARGKKDPRLDPHGYQRVLSPKRLREIGEYLERRDARLPNAIIVNFAKGASFTPIRHVKNVGYLEIPNEKYSVWIVDGQHRLYGFDKRRKDTPFNVLVAGYVKLPRKHQARLFRVINDTQKKMDPSLVYDLLDFYDPSEPYWFIHKIVKSLNEDENSPWREKINMVGGSEPGTWVKQVAFTYLLKKYWKKEGAFIRIRRTRRDGKVLYDHRIKLRELIRIMKDYFLAISQTCRSYWSKQRGSMLKKSLGINGWIGYLPYVLTALKKVKREYKNITINDFLRYLKPFKKFNFSSRRKFSGGYKGFDELTEKLIEWKRRA